MRCGSPQSAQAALPLSPQWDIDVSDIDITEWQLPLGTPQIPVALHDNGNGNGGEGTLRMTGFPVFTIWASLEFNYATGSLPPSALLEPAQNPETRRLGGLAKSHSNEIQSTLAGQWRRRPRLEVP